MSRLLIIMTLLMVGIFPAAGGERHFYTPIHDAGWRTDTGVLQCSLSQQIPNFGTVTFTSYAGGNFTLMYNLEREKPVRPVQKAVLSAEPPPWRQNIRASEITTTTLVPGKKAIIFSRDAALRALYELEKGMAPTLHFADWVDARDQMRVTTTAVRLKEALTEFQVCSGNLHPDGFEDVNRRTLYFKPDNIELNPKYYEDLNRIADYVKVDDAIERVVIKGYADDRGPEQYNEELSQMRVDTIRNYLLDRGVSEGKLVSIYFGEMQAKSSGRSEDRRVEIELIRESS
ncbi:MAG: OmpA family protein [Gammaproteobacteria bacterium]|nr:OmpA family protein [Gammaproteobacteria bacterium]